MANELKDSYRKIFLRTGLDDLDNLSSRREGFVDKDAKEIACDELIGNPTNNFLADNFNGELDLLLEKDDARIRQILKINVNN